MAETPESMAVRVRPMPYEQDFERIGGGPVDAALAEYMRRLPAHPRIKGWAKGGPRGDVPGPAEG